MARKHWEKEKLLIRSYFSFCHSVFKRLMLQTCKNQGLFWKGLKYLQENMDRCTGSRNITEILLKTALNTIRSNNLFHPITVTYIYIFTFVFSRWHHRWHRNMHHISYRIRKNPVTAG